jgi:hypothetical protein
MAPTRALLALSVVLLLGTGVAAAVSGQPVLEATLQSDAVTPGEETTLSMTITNNGSVEVGSRQNPALTDRVTTARGLIMQVDPDDEAPITVHSGNYSVGSLPGGGAAPLDVPVTVDQNASAGDYRLPINVTYRYTSQIDGEGVEETETVRRDLNVTLHVEETPRIRVHNATTSLRVGTTDTLNVTVANVGPVAAADARVSLSSPNAGVTLVGSGSATRYVGDWAAGEAHSLEFEVRAADSAGTTAYPLELQTTFEDRDGRTDQSETRRFTIVPGPAQRFAVGNVSGTLAVGAEGQVTGTVTNTGAEAVTGTVVVFADDGETISPLSTEYAVGRLGAGDSADFDFPIEVSEAAEAGPRQFDVHARYRTDPATVLQSPTLDVRTDIDPERPNFEVSTEAATVEPGGQSRLRVTVTNTGGETYSDVSAKLFAESPLSTDDDEGFVSELEPGDSTEITFGLGASSGAITKEYPVSIDFRYDDSEGDTQTSDTYRLPVTVVEPEDDGGPPYVLIGAAVGLLLLLAGGYYWTRR